MSPQYYKRKLRHKLHLLSHRQFSKRSLAIFGMCFGVFLIAVPAILAGVISTGYQSRVISDYTKLPSGALGIVVDSDQAGLELAKAMSADSSMQGLALSQNVLGESSNRNIELDELADFCATTFANQPGGKLVVFAPASELTAAMYICDATGPTIYGVPTSSELGDPISQGLKLISAIWRVHISR